MVINQGDVYWIDLVEPIGSEPGHRHPYVVIQKTCSTTAGSIRWLAAL